MSWPTTRRHPRTLREAFPRDHANWLWCDSRGHRWLHKLARAIGWALAIAFFAAWGAVTAHWFVSGIA